MKKIIIMKRIIMKNKIITIANDLMPRCCLQCPSCGDQTSVRGGKIPHFIFFFKKKQNSNSLCDIENATENFENISHLCGQNISHPCGQNISEIISHPCGLSGAEEDSDE